jgi:ABC-type dipeptide/oligopeptide/nickel transport system permease component
VGTLESSKGLSGKVVEAARLHRRPPLAKAGKRERVVADSAAFNPQNLEALRADLGLDEPLPEQFLIYVSDTARFNFGGSFYYRGAPVSEVIASRIWPTSCCSGP